MQTLSQSARPAHASRFAIRINREFESVRDDWNRLERDGLCTAFQTYDWLRPFYDRLVPQLGLDPLFVRVMDLETNTAAMLFPLTTGRHLGLRTVTFADAGVSDYGSPLWSRSFKPTAPEREALWRDIASRPALGSVLKLHKLPSLINGEPNGLLPGIVPSATLDFGAWNLPLPRSLDRFEANSLTPSFRKDLRMRRRRLERKGAVVFEAARSVAEREVAFDALVAQRGRRFAEMGRNDVLADSRFRAFYKASAVDEPNATVRLFTLKVAGEIVAVLLALDHAGVRHVVMPTFEAGEWKNCSPGNVLIHMAIERSIEEGFDHFDFTIGDEPYKATFGARRSELFDALAPLTPAGAGMLKLIALARSARQRAAVGVRPPLVSVR